MTFSSAVNHLNYLKTTLLDLLGQMLRIGNLELDNWLVMAPMAGITNLPFRLMVKRMGAALVTTEMISAMGLTLNQKKSISYLSSDPFEKPLAIQIFGSEPAVMAKAAEMVVKAGASIVDINLGCPVKKVIKTGAGGALLRAPKKIMEIVSAVRRACVAPLTVKMRAGWSPDRFPALDTARLVEDCGADAITLHPRFVTQGFAGNADWRMISEFKRKLKIPVIGNGDVHNPLQALKMKRQTGCNGVMIGRGAIGNPWIFKQILDLENGRSVRQPQLHERKTMIMEHFRLLTLLKGESHAARCMRGLLLWYTKGMANSSRFRGSITSIKDLNTLLLALDQYFNTLKDKDK